ncbi:kelch repeat and BTB domain-containing protein 11-like [Coregonus clupeaformis]|uniref:kelch repeat and BTB domain-containing protein 11-like n=1 Tax=Coregonus clupeaformis TaxID=59861 RepID=UPI001BDF7897|nr:kelch repeat and BTB domain-containing protein 11-like [Coregonus clupeaformis]
MDNSAQCVPDLRLLSADADTPPACHEKEQVDKMSLLMQDFTGNIPEIKDPDENQNFGYQCITETNGPLVEMDNVVMGLRFYNGSQPRNDSVNANVDQKHGSLIHCNSPQTNKEQHCSIERDAVEENYRAQADVAHSLGYSLCCLDDETQAQSTPLVCEVSGGAVKYHCLIDKASSQVGHREGSSAPVTYCITAEALQVHQRGQPGSAGQTAVWRESDADATQGNPALQSRQEGWGCGNRVFASKEETDLVIEVSGKKLEAHKAVLAEKSDYFKARQSRDVLRVKGVSFKTLTILVDYIYSCRMEVSKDNIVEVITGAKILQIPCAVQAAVDTMSEQITAENCYEILTIAKRQRLSELKEKAYKYMSDNFLQILRDPDVYGRLTGGERELILTRRMEGKRVLMVAEINEVYDCVGSRPPSRENSRPQSPLSMVSLKENRMIYYYNKETKDWKVLTKMPDEINTKGSGICTMYNYLFVAGGIKRQDDKGKVSDKVFCYNPLTDSWSEIRPLTEGRSQLKLVSMDGYLFAIGGECLFTVEKYDPRMDRWRPVAPLPKGAFAIAHEATTCNGEMFVSGGSLFYRLLRYDTRRDDWEECPFNNSRKKSTDMVAFKNFIYRFDVNRDYGVNVFKYNTVVKIWHNSASLEQTNPLPFRCAVIGNTIYCVNKAQTLQFVVEEENEQFLPEAQALKAPIEAKGALVPFVLALPKTA